MIPEYGTFDITRGMLDALVSAGLLSCSPNRDPFGRSLEETSRQCTVTSRGYAAVDSGFAPEPPPAPTHISIGAIIESMSGGTLQAVGAADHTEISQIVNDPALLRSEVESLTERLVNEVKGSLNVEELGQYTVAIRELRAQLAEEKPDPGILRGIVRTVGLLGDIEGTISLMVRVWPLLQALLMIAAVRLA